MSADCGLRSAELFGILVLLEFIYRLVNIAATIYFAVRTPQSAVEVASEKGVEPIFPGSKPSVLPIRRPRNVSRKLQFAVLGTTN